MEHVKSVMNLQGNKELKENSVDLMYVGIEKNSSKTVHASLVKYLRRKIH